MAQRTLIFGLNTGNTEILVSHRWHREHRFFGSNTDNTDNTDLYKYEENI